MVVLPVNLWCSDVYKPSDISLQKFGWVLWFKCLTFSFCLVEDFASKFKNWLGTLFFTYKFFLMLYIFYYFTTIKNFGSLEFYFELEKEVSETSDSQSCSSPHHKRQSPKCLQNLVFFIFEAEAVWAYIYSMFSSPWRLSAVVTWLAMNLLI